MGWGTGNLGGGSDGELNFKVVGNPQPASAKENTIWVNTDNKITVYYFQEEQPENMAEGEMWFYTGTSSPVAFNALKKNSVMVYPISAKQMVGGALVDVDAMSYQGGEWVDWPIFIVKNGIIGKLGFSTNAYNASYPPTVTFGDGYIEYASTSGFSAAFVADSKIDLSNRNRIEFTVDVIAVNTSTTIPSNMRGVSVVVLNSIVNSSITALSNAIVASAMTTVTGNDQKLAIDDLTGIEGEYYVGFIIGEYGTSKGKIRVRNLEVS